MEARRGVVGGQGWEEEGAGRMPVMRGREDGVKRVWSDWGWMSGVERDPGWMMMMYRACYGNGEEKANVEVGVGDRSVWCNHKHHPWRTMYPLVKIQLSANASDDCSAVIVESWKGPATATAVEDLFVEDSRAEEAVAKTRYYHCVHHVEGAAQYPRGAEVGVVRPQVVVVVVVVGEAQEEVAETPAKTVMEVVA